MCDANTIFPINIIAIQNKETWLNVMQYSRLPQQKAFSKMWRPLNPSQHFSHRSRVRNSHHFNSHFQSSVIMFTTSATSSILFNRIDWVTGQIESEINQYRWEEGVKSLYHLLFGTAISVPDSGLFSINTFYFFSHLCIERIRHR